MALKIQRRRYAPDATWEIYIHHHVSKAGSCLELIKLRDFFLHEGHVCMVFDKHGGSLERTLRRGALPFARVRRISRQILTALAHLHSCGYAHTDVKPGNILYNPRTGDARLADLGSSRKLLRQGSHPGTREYMAPEILIGTPLSSAMDLWSLGCTVFEMLTGRLLFSPRRVAARKYREFSDEAAALPLDPVVLADEAAEAAEQFRRGEIIAGKYELKDRLGQGRFGTVWSARPLHPRSLGDPISPVWDHAESVATSRPSQSDRDRADAQWRLAKGADDMVDLALRYEHTLLVSKHCGPFPRQMIGSAKYRASYFEPDGEHRFRPVIRKVSIRELLRRGSSLRGSVLETTSGFLGILLQIDPALRASAKAASEHPWLKQGSLRQS